MSQSLLCVAIDFGTTYSGYSVKVNLPKLKRHFEEVDWGHEFGVKTCKTPTCILFDTAENFLAFGYAAMKKYHDEERRENLYLFENFKMDLYKNNVSTNMSLL